MKGKVSHFKNGGWRGGSFPMGFKSQEIDGRKILVVNKDDEFKDEVLSTVIDYRNALTLVKKDSNSFNTQVLKCSALKKTGIEEIWKIILSFKVLGNKKGWIKEKRAKQLEKWMWNDLQKSLFEKIIRNKKLVT